MLSRLFHFKARTQVRYIFILSAMRCGSTLLQHIIGQHEYILSAGETKVEYAGREQLATLREHLFNYNGIEENRQIETDWIYLEKSVHERYLVSLQNMQGPDTRFIFMLRRPHPALTSLMERKGWPYTESVESAGWYYEKRPERLVELAAELHDGNHAYFLTYEDFLANTAKHLKKLTSFLHMAPPLKATYPKQKWTAKMSLGDVSSNIKMQSVVANQRDQLIELPEAILNRINKSYEESCRELARMCLT